MSELYALLIGVDFYFPNQLPGGGGYGHLGGCVRDVTHVEAHLRDRLGLPSSHIFKLTATNAGGAAPAEPPEQWPTYDNIVTTFRRVKALARPGDRVYLHYAGHGGRTVTAFPELKSDGLDEGLVPTDIGNAHSNFLRDVELHYLIQELLDEKQVILTVVLDSCHSGGATRAAAGQLSAVPRGTNQIDRADRPLSDLVAPYADLVAQWRTQAPTREHTRAVQEANGWLLEPKGYTLLAACRPNELAYEYPFNGVERNGALTYWLLDTLRQAGPSFTYKMLHDRVLAKVHGQFAQQTPMLQGESDVVVFGADRIKPYYAVPVIQTQGERVQINAGEAHGLSSRAQLAIYPLGTTDFQATPRSALLELDQINAVEAWGTLIEGNSTDVEAGAQAVLLGIADLNFQRKVGLDVADPSVRQALETELATQGKGFARLANPGEAIDYFVELTEAGELVIEDAGDQPIPNLRPAIYAHEANAVQRTVERLVHLARYRGVQELQVNDAAAAQKLRVELIGNVVNRPGDRVGLRITNTQSPGDDSRILNITVLNLSSDWSIAQIYPAGAGAFQPLSPGETINLQFDAYLPEGQTESKDVLKVFATTATTNFRWLELSALDQPITRSATRSASMNPLEQLLAAVTEEQSTTRAVRLVSSSEDKAWTVAEVELGVQQATPERGTTPSPAPAMQAPRQESRQYDLVFEGGGAKGMVFIGAYQVMAERGLTPGRLLGTSAGAITAALIAAGYTPQEMLDALTERVDNQPVFTTFMGDPLPFDDKAVEESAIRKFLRDIDFTFIPNFLEDKIDAQIAQALASRGRGRNFFSLIERGGWFSAHNFLSWMSRRLDSGTFRGQPRQFSKLTLAQFHAINGVDLSLIAADATGGSLLVLNHRTAPDCPLIYAVRMSMSIPLLWDEVIWQPEWGTYRGHDLTGHAIVDGGMLSNFPIELFISDEAPVTAVMGAKQDNPILGLLIDDTLPVPAPRGLLVKSNVQLGQLQTLQRLMRLINTATTAHDKMVIEAFEHLVVRLPAAGYGTTEFDMSDERREALIDAGRVTMRAYLDNPPAPAAVARGQEAVAAQQAQREANHVALNILSH